MFKVYLGCGFVMALIFTYFNIDGSQAIPQVMNANKPGSCPPPLSRMICSNLCTTDLHCPRNEKCCETNCGGAICTRPATTRTNTTLVKQGLCPPFDEGPWFCSSTCRSDGDCRGSKKCCRNRCGAYACKVPLKTQHLS